MKPSVLHLLAFTGASLPLMYGQESTDTTRNRPLIDPNSKDVRSSITYDLGDKLLTIQEVTEETLPTPPPPPESPSALPPSPPPTLAETLLAQVEKARHHDLSMGGTIYRTLNGPARSLITYYQNEGKAPVVFWSSIDWNLLTPGGFESPDGQTYSLMLMLSTVDIAKLAEESAASDDETDVPVIPAFPAGLSSFQIVSGDSSPQLLADIRALHAIHDRDHTALLAAWNEREAARVKADVDRAANPPQPQNIVLQYRMLKPEELQGN